MKYLGLILFSATLLGCGSQDLGNTPNKNVAGNSNGQGLTFLDIKPASSLSSNTKPIKKGKSVEINGNVFEVSTLGGSESFVEGENNGYVIGGSAIPMPAEEVEGEEVSDLAVHAFVQKDGVIKDPD